MFRLGGARLNEVLVRFVNKMIDTKCQGLPDGSEVFVTCPILATMYEILLVLLSHISHNHINFGNGIHPTTGIIIPPSPQFCSWGTEGGCWGETPNYAFFAHLSSIKMNSVLNKNEF